MNQMTEVMTATLIGRALDWAVGEVHAPDEPRLYCDKSGNWRFGAFDHMWNPSSDWDQGGPLLTKYLRNLVYYGEKDWFADVGLSTGTSASSPSILIAVCRAIVRGKRGDTIKVPTRLLP